MAVRGRRRIAPARRKMIWARSVPAIQATVAGSLAVDLLAPFRAQGGDTLGCTITRVRLDLTWSSAVDAPGLNGFQLGVIKDQLQALQAEVPRPLNEEHADWMAWQFLPTVNPWTSADVADVLGAHYMIDVQSQRRMEELGETLYLIMEQTSVAIAQFTLTSSVLLKLP